MAGALIGLTAGMALRYAGQQHAERLSRETSHQNFLKENFMKGLHEHPEQLMNGASDKEGKRLFQDDWEGIKGPMMAAAAEAQRNIDFRNKIQPVFQQALGSLLGIPSGSFGVPGAPTQPGAGGGGTVGAGAGAPPNVPSPAANPPAGSTPLPGGPPPQMGGAGVQDISARGTATLAPTAPPPVSGAPQVPGAAGASPPETPLNAPAASAAPLSPGQKLQQIELARGALGSLNLDPEMSKSLSSMLEQMAKTEQQKIGTDKPPAQLQAVTKAYFGDRAYNDLSPTEKQLALRYEQDLKDSPALAAWNIRQDRIEATRQAAQDRQDHQSQIVHGGAMRQGLVALMNKHAAQMITLNKPGVSQEEKEAGKDAMNSEVAAMQQSITDDINAGYLPSDFKPLQRFKNYSVDPKTGGVFGYFKKAGMLHPTKEGSEPSKPSSSGNEVPTSTPPVPGAIRGTYKGKSGWRDPHDPTAFYPD